MKYRSCKDCPEYQKCVKSADLRIKRAHCEHALKPKDHPTEKDGGQE